MTTLAIPYETDVRTVGLTRGSVVRKGNDLEFVIEIFYRPDEKPVRFWTARRNEKAIAERHHSLRDGFPHLDYVGEVYKSSERYSELNAILEEFEKKQK